MFQKILIANRGEIAVRIIRACRELGIQTVAVYSEADKDSLHTMLADEAVCIGPASPAESYLKMENIISATIASGAEAIHPGFGFLSENTRFAELCEKCNIKFIGPSSQVIAAMGDKASARKTMKAAGVPVTPGSDEAITDAVQAKEIADEIGYPVIIKASNGGGGKGMRVAESPESFEEMFLLAQTEAINAFGDGRMYIEKYITVAKHIEVQILADGKGHAISLGERDCSIQRKHQKLIEEAPACSLSPELRKRINEAAVLAAKAANYENAGTIEFLVPDKDTFYFMEMNTRLQVEHSISEEVTGVDIVKEQLKIASGEGLKLTQEDIKITGHSIECRINAEDAEKGFRPCPGKITDVFLPAGRGVRLEHCIYSGLTIQPFYDSMVLKLIVKDNSRLEAIHKMQSALGELIIEGITTTQDFLYDILHDEEFIKGDFNTGFIEDYAKRNNR
jgi:acetyl-CoA carboxylase biotin carboxylase subunit